jgi:undecaprenyl-phosphate glucose phosphotransferase
MSGCSKANGASNGSISLSAALKECHSPRRFQKIALDWTLAVILSIVLAVPFILIAVAIKLDSLGPVFFRQPRVGYRNRRFLIWKFRTMQAATMDIGGTQLTTRGDPRITRVGSWLRRWSIDELPQIWNVVIGDMSLVGPRPHPIYAKAGDRLYQEVVPNYAQRHIVKPGITGWAQVNGWRGETHYYYQIQQRVAYDLDYIERQSLTFDLKIMLLTIVREVRSKTAF